MKRKMALVVVALAGGAIFDVGIAQAQLRDVTQTPNAANAGIRKSYAQEIGVGRGDIMTPNSSAFIINRDPFRAIRRGRQIFQRKFQLKQGFGPTTNDGEGNVAADASISAGLVDSCAGCHGRPRGAAGFGGDVVTRPDSRDAPHLFGLGLQEQLGDEITQALRTIRTLAIQRARNTHTAVTLPLRSKGISYGTIKALPTGVVDTSGVQGVDPDLRVRPFFAQGGTISIREFLVGAFNAEMGMEANDPDLLTASTGGIIITPSGMILDGSKDHIEGPPVVSATQDGDGDGKINEIPTSIVDFMEFYLLHYFKPGTGEQTDEGTLGRALFSQMGCNSCHIPNLTIDRDRRVADLETTFDPVQGNPFNRLFATATPFLTAVSDGSGFPDLKRAKKESFVVRNFFADLKRHDLGPNFYELNYDGTMQKVFVTEPLWGVGTTAPYGHDGRSGSLQDVILRHGGEAQASRDQFDQLPEIAQGWVTKFLSQLVLFAPDDTASNLSPAVPATVNYPQKGHGAIALTVLFNDPTDVE